MSIQSDPESIFKTDETRDLISSEKVDGTAVFSRDGEKLGSIHHFMVGKLDGQVRYAVLNFGGLFAGDSYHPLPWDVLTYNTNLGGYEVGLTKELLKEAPSFNRGSEPIFDAKYDREIQGYYARR